jgi:hypothetical protein
VEIHEAILENLDFFCRNNIQLVIASIISKWNIARYLDFVEWLEQKYHNQIQDGMLVPIPVSLVSFGNQKIGRLNPSAEEVSAFEEAVYASSLLTVRRTRDWLFKQMIGHYRTKQRFFERGETLNQIASNPSRYSCEIFRYMISFNFQDEEILRPTSEALFQGYLCGVKVLGNIGHALYAHAAQNTPLFKGRPSNMHTDRKYFGTEQVMEYIHKREVIINDQEVVEMGDRVGYFSDLKKGMCMLDDFDGVWWPFNLYLQGIVDDETLGEFWALFRNKRLIETLRKARQNSGEVPTRQLTNLQGLQP